MTNELSTERAIEALYTVRAYYASLTAGYPKGKDCRGIGDVMCSEIANSCLMGIKALEQIELNPSYNGVKTELEPCEDECIEKYEAIRRIEVRRKITCESNPYNYEEWTKGYEEGIDDAIAMINSVPSVTPSIMEWLESFNTDSATECFTAVQQLKEKMNEN